MKKRTSFAYSIFLLISWISLAEADENGKSFTVQKTFDNRSFTYFEKPLADRPGYKVLRLYYPSPITTAVEQNNRVPADYYLPDGIGPGAPKRPVVICLHILDGNDALTEMLCSALAARGIPAFAFKLPYYGERGLSDGPLAMARDPKLLVSALEQTAFDVRRTVDLLASRPEIDTKKIGIAGISLGGIVAASAAGSEPRIHRAAFLLAGGDVLSIIHHAEETRPLSQTLKNLPADERSTLEGKIVAADPLRFASGLRDRAEKGQVLMINATDDEVIPRRCTEKLADALAIPDKIVWLDRLGHYTSMAELPATLDTTAEFFAHDLPPGVNRPSTASRTPEMRRLADVMRQASALLAETPERGKQHNFEVRFSATNGGPQSFEGRVRVVRDSDRRFFLSYQLPVLGELCLGQGDFPWIVADGAALCGTQSTGPALKHPQELLPAGRQIQLRYAAGLLTALSRTPEVLLRFMSVESDRQSGGQSRLMLLGKAPLSARLEMTFRKEAETLTELRLETANFKCSIRLRDVQVNSTARSEQFSPPATLQKKPVAQREVYDKFASLIAFLELMAKM